MLGEAETLSSFSFGGQGSNRSFYLPRLPKEHYQGNSVVHWTLPMARRATGWLNPTFHTHFRESMLHVAAREGLFCPVYCLMPDHLHLFCAPYDLRVELDTWIKYWKRLFTQRHPAQEWHWQRRGFHHRMRDRIEYEESLLYVQESPLRKGLVKQPADLKLRRRVHDIQS